MLSPALHFATLAQVNFGEGNVCFPLFYLGIWQEALPFLGPG